MLNIKAYLKFQLLHSDTYIVFRCSLLLYLVKMSNKDEEENLLILLRNADYETKQKIKRELNEILEVS